MLFPENPFSSHPLCHKTLFDKGNASSVFIPDEVLGPYRHLIVGAVFVSADCGSGSSYLMKLARCPNLARLSLVGRSIP